MPRRRHAPRRPPARRSPPGAPISPFLPAAGVNRRRSPWPRLAVFAAFALIVAGGAAAVVASATSTTSPQSGAVAVANRAGPAPASHRPSRRADPHATGAPALQAENQAVDRVLAYTPFVRSGVGRRRLIALSFDDGPSPYTPALVRELVRLHAPATFFIVGQQLRYFAAGLHDELRHGFAIGDHTENHAPLNLLGTSLQYGQIDDAARAISRLGAPYPRLFRPPYGFYNANTFAILRQLRMLMVMWSVDPRDWVRPGAATIVQRVLGAARPGAIVELHDGGGDRSQTVAAVPAIIRALRRRGYQFASVPELLAADPPPRHQTLPHVSE